MNRLKSLLVATFASLTAVAASHAAEDVILTVKVDEALANYYKVENFLAEMQESEAEVTKRADEIRAEGNALVEELQDLRAQAESDILTEQARNDAKADAQAMFQRIQQKQQELNQYLGASQNQFAARHSQQMNLFYSEITDIVNEISKERAATLVLDISIRAMDGRPSVLYTDGSYDITPEVIERINSTKGQEASEEAAAE